MAKTSADNLRFTAKDVYGNLVNLAKVQENYDYVLVVFLRYAGCPWCNLAIHRLTLEHKQLLNKKCQVIAFVQSSRKHVIRDVYNKHNPKPLFPIIPDQDMKIYKQYDVSVSVGGSLKMITQLPYWLKGAQQYGFKQVDGNLFIVPAWFLINTQNNTVIKSQKNANFFNHETFISIYDSLTFKD
jgi:peroxiredoxin Q/BCP